MNRIAFICSILLFSISSFAQRTEAVLILKDGTRVEGLGGLTKAQTIKFKKTKKDKRQKFTFQEVDTLKIKEPNETIYVKVRIKDQEQPLVLEIISMEGKVIHYQKVTYGGGVRSYPVYHHYLRKVNEDEAIDFGKNAVLTKNFKKIASKFFEDCEKLVQAIQSERATRYDLKEIIKYYNDKCD